MHTADPSAGALAKADVPPSPEERLHELAAVLAAGGGRQGPWPRAFRRRRGPSGRSAAVGGKGGGRLRRSATS